MVVFFGFGVSFAASSDVRDSIYSSEETLLAVDNGLVVSADLDNFNFNLRINSVTEDDKNYYATYSYLTLTIEDGAWQNKEIEKTLTVNKEALEGKDFGLYLAKELGENINYELSYLKRVQRIEREKGESQKIVTIEYSGLVGKLLDPKEMIIEGYEPVIPEIIPEEPVDIQSNPEEVIVSTPYVDRESLPESAENEIESGEDNTSEASSSETTETGVVDEANNEESAIKEESTPLPAPEEMVDEELIQEVVGELLQEETIITDESPEPPVSETIVPVQEKTPQTTE